MKFNRIGHAIKNKLGTLRELPDYFAAVRIEWVNVAWGVGVPAVAFILLWSLDVIESPKTIAYFFVWALFMAGYYLWRANYVRLLPKFEIRRYRIQPSPNRPTGRSVWVQLELECMTDAIIEECQGWLLDIRHRYPENSGIGDDEWEETAINEPLALGWSISDSYDPVTLYPGVPKRLNVFSFYSELPSQTVPQISAKGIPLLRCIDPGRRVPVSRTGSRQRLPTEDMLLLNTNLGIHGISRVSGWSRLRAPGKCWMEARTFKPPGCRRVLL